MATVFAAAGHVLSARALLLLSLVGAFVVALRCVEIQTPLAAAMLGVYCLLTVGPVAWLEHARRSDK